VFVFHHLVTILVFKLFIFTVVTRNSSGDEIANVNLKHAYDDIVYTQYKIQ